MKESLYLLSEAAEDDLRGILQYTIEQHSDSQAIKYSTQIERCALDLANGKIPFKEMPEIHPGLRCVRCAHHVLFALFRNNQPMIIIAIFHERMDLLKRVTNRLK